MIGLKRSHDLINLPCSFQLNCLYQVVLFLLKTRIFFDESVKYLLYRIRIS